jgi:mannosyltransferase OCH1-like enzyme
MGLIIEKINLYQFKNFIRELNEPRLSNEMPSNYLLIGNNLCNNSNELAFRDNVKGYPYNIAPNIVHYILFSIPEIRFSKFMSLLSVLRNQKPDQIIIHCDCDHLNGEYYKLILKIIPKTRTILTIRQIEKPTKIFFRNLNKKWLNWHSADVTRTKLLLEFGSIYIDQDVYVVQNLDKFMKYEMTLSLNVMELMSNGIFIAHKNSRFLRLYLDLYRNYDSNE